MYVNTYEIVIPKYISSLPSRTNRVGGFCSRALTNLKTVLNTVNTEKMNRNKNNESTLNISFHLFCVQEFQFSMFVTKLSTPVRFF